MARIAFVSRLDREAEAVWVDHLRRAMPRERIDRIHDLNADDRARADIAIVANPDPADLAALPNLTWVQSLWAGVDRLVAELKGFPHPIVRLVDPELTRTMAEAALAWTYYLFRDMPAYGAQQRARQWAQRPYSRPADTTVAILGLGELGAAAAARLRDAGFSVTGWSRTPKALPGVDCRSGPEGLDSLLAQADILICLLPLTEQTRGLLNAERFARMRRGAQIINFARGPIIDDQALLAALDSRRIRHAVLDVFDVEPLPETSPFWSHPAVTVLPHISAATDCETAALIVARQVADYRSTSAIPQAVDLSRAY